MSDAGTPLISDPGFKLVREVCAAGYAVIAVPGPSSVLAALSWRRCRPTGFSSRGFCRRKEAARRARLTELSRIDATLVMFESGNRVQDTLADLADIMGGRDAAICRELTKLHEEIMRAPVAELAAGRRHAGDPRRIRAGDRPAGGGRQVMTDERLDDLLRSSLQRDSVKDAVAHAVELSGRPRREVYARALELAKESAEAGRWRRLTARAARQAGKNRLARAGRRVSHRACPPKPAPPPI